MYEPCYDSCATCSEIGGENDHKCDICKDGYEKLNNDNNYYKVYTHYLLFWLLR